MRSDSDENKHERTAQPTPDSIGVNMATTQVVWQSEEIQAAAGAAEVTIPRDEFDLPSVGPSYFWKV